MKINLLKRLLKNTAAILLAVFLCNNTSIANSFGLWINANSTNSYSDASKWIPIDGSLPGGIPGPGNDAYIFDGTLLVEGSGNFNPQQLIMGWENSHVGEYLQTGGSTRTEYWTKVGNAGNQIFNQSGGIYSTGDMAVGWKRDANIGLGVMNLNGGTFESRAATFIGLEGATGVMNINGGVYNAVGNSWGSFRIADYGTGTGTLNLSDSGVVNASQYTAVGGWGNGTLNITGGTWNQTSGGIVVGDFADTNWTGRGIVNQAGGQVNADMILLQQGTYNLNGGNLSAFGIADTSASGMGIFNFNGGVLLARDNNTNFIEANTVDIKSGGATIDTSNKEVWVSKDISGTGGLVKTGLGTLKLTGANSYTGATAVNAGTLIVNGSLQSSDVIVATGTTLAGSGSLQSVTLQGGTLSPGNSPGLLTASSLDASNGNFIFELGAPTTRGVTYDAIDVANLLKLGSGTSWQFQINNGYAFQMNDSYDLFNFGSIDTTGFDISTFQASLPNLDTANSGLQWSVDIFTTDGVVSVIPEPSSLGLLIIGGSMLYGLRRLRRNG